MNPLHITHAEDILRKTLGSSEPLFVLEISYGENKGVRISKSDGTPIFVEETNALTGHVVWKVADEASGILGEALSKAAIYDYHISHDGRFVTAGPKNFA